MVQEGEGRHSIMPAWLVGFGCKDSRGRTYGAFFLLFLDIEGHDSLFKKLRAL
jgi:hypothetical protein